MIAWVWMQTLPFGVVLVCSEIWPYRRNAYVDNTAFKIHLWRESVYPPKQPHESGREFDSKAAAGVVHIVLSEGWKVKDEG